MINPSDLLSMRITELLDRKRAIEERVLQTNRMESDHNWLVDAVELLLRIELERHGDPNANR